LITEKLVRVASNRHVKGRSNLAKVEVVGGNRNGEPWEAVPRAAKAFPEDTG
jgi:hypothetical protein